MTRTQIMRLTMSLHVLVKKSVMDAINIWKIFIQIKPSADKELKCLFVIENQAEKRYLQQTSLDHFFRNVFFQLNFLYIIYFSFLCFYYIIMIIFTIKERYFWHFKINVFLIVLIYEYVFII